VLASPFARLHLCGCFRSSAVGAALAQKYPKGIKVLPAKDRRAREMALERPRQRSATRPAGGWSADTTAAIGDPKYGETIISSWAIVSK